MHRRRFLASVAVSLGITGCLGTQTPACPPFDTDTDRTVCYRTQSDDEPIWISVSHPDWTIVVGDNTVETNIFTLHNESDTDLRFNPHNWALYEEMSTDWKKISEDGNNGAVTIASGGTYRWSLSRVSHPSPNSENTEYITVDVGVGKYAFLVNVPDSLGDGSLACIAVFSVHIAAPSFHVHT